MTGIKKRLGSLLGPPGQTPQFIQGQTEQLVPERGAQVNLVRTGAAEYRVDFGIPEGKQGRQGLPGVNALPADEAVAAYLSDEDTNTRHAADALYPIQRGQGVAPLRDATQPELITGDMKYPIAVINGELYGATYTSNRHIYVSHNSGDSWVEVAALPTSSSSINKLWPTGDGEMIAQNFTQLWKSNGWATNPSAAIWQKVLDLAPRATQFAAFSVDVRGHRVMAADYGAYANRPWRLFVSTDYGDTFTLSLNLEDVYTSDHLLDTHYHGVTIDHWRDVLYVTNGDNETCNLWYSRDDGTTWQIIEHDWAKKRHTALQAMPEGMLIGSDHGSVDTQDGIYRINPDDPDDVTFIHRIDTGESGLRLIGGSSTFGPDGTGWMVMYPHAIPGQPSILMASASGTQSHEVWRDPEPDPVSGQNRYLYAVYGPDKNGWIHGKMNSAQHRGWTFKARYARTGVPEYRPAVSSGDSGDPSGTAAHPTAKSFRHGVAVGHNADAGSQTDSTQTIAIGYGSVVGENQNSVGSVAVGAEAEADGPNAAVFGRRAQGAGSSVAVGFNSQASNTGGVSVGYLSEAQEGVAIGNQAKAPFARSIAIGRISDTISADAVAVGDQSSAGFRSVAIGRQASADHAGSIALGFQQETTAPEQLQLGARHFELQAMERPFIPAQGSARLYLRTNANGKDELCIIFAGMSEPIVIATQP